MQILDKLKPLGLLVLRLGVAAVLFSAGYDKLFRAPARWLKWFPQHGFPAYLVYAVGSLELFGAILLVLGLLTRIVGILVAIDMAIMITKVNVPRGGIYHVDEYALPLLLGVACFALATVGAGFLSVDAATFESGAKSKARAKPPR